MEPAVKSKTWARNRLIRDGIYQAIYEQMKVDQSIYLFGEGSHMKVHFDAPYIEKEFADRVITLPICVKGDTLILGDNKPMSSLMMGNLAFGGNGELNQVSEVMKRPFYGDMISIKARYLQEIVATAEHPIKVVRRESMKFECGVFRPQNKRNVNPEWVPVRNVGKGDFLVVPRLKSEPTAIALDLGSYRKYKSDSRALDSFPVDPDTAWLLGLYVAEGCTNLSMRHKEYIQFSLHENELTLFEKVKEIFASLGNGYKVRAYKKPGCHGIELQVSCTILARAIGVWCGKGALDKQVPDFIMTADNQIKTAFLRGLFDGDGSLSGNTKSLHSSSKKLVLQAQLLVASLGGMMGISRKKPAKAMLKSENRVIQSKESWWLEGSSPDVARIFGHAYSKQPQRNYVVTGDSILVPVTSVSKHRYEGDVFNIETTDHTYLVNNAIVHNCEDGNTNFAVGTSLVGIKPIVDVISSDFLFRTMDSICNTAAKLNHVSADIDKPKTIVIRSEFFLGGPCLLPKSRVWYNPRPEMVGTSSDNRIYGGDGNSVDIREESWQAYRGDAYTIKPHCLQPIKVTEEHPFYIARIKTNSDSRSHYAYTHKQKKMVWEGWARAKDLRSRDYLVIPKLMDRGERQFIELRPKTYRGGGAVDKDLEITEMVASFLGWYVAEGSFKDNGEITLTLNKNSDPVDEIRDIVSSMGYSTYISAHGENSINLGFKSRMLAPWLAQHVGRGARSKRVPAEIFDSTNNIKLTFLRSYFLGDGYLSDDYIGAKTASEDLFYDVTYLLLSLGIVASTSVGIDKGHTLNGQFVKGGESYQIRVCGKQQQLLGRTRVNSRGTQLFVEQENRFLLPIKKISKFHYEGPIYNVVTEDHTYLAPVVTHNTTGQRTESLFTHIPGLNVVLPSNPKDARGLMKTALTNPGITVFFEDRMINDSDTKESDKDTGVTESIPFGKAKVRRRGRGLTVVSYALALKEVEAVVENHKVDCDLIDPRTLYPLDCDTICDSVSKTGRLLIVEPDVTYAGIGAEIAASVVERSFSALKRPIIRLGAPRTVTPASQGLHKYVMPSRDDILRDMRELSN